MVNIMGEIADAVNKYGFPIVMAIGTVSYTHLTLPTE